MTANVGTKARIAKLAASQSPAIGEADAHVFTCPACSRPLSNGTMKCPGCGSRLIMGVLVKRAGAILALGIAIGVVVGGGLMGSIAMLSASADTAAIQQPVATIPTAAPVAAAVPTAAPPLAAAPQTAIAALSGTAVVNGRITVDAMSLKTTLATRGVSTIEIARALRSLAADAALGMDLTGRMAPWTDARPVTAELDAFYRSMASAARDGLRASLTDAGAYRASATAMLATIEDLGTVDASSRTLAATVSLELAPVVHGTAGSAPSASPGS
jgi:predicted lysophospholipase L1 biosynthesis ABC-type transport system permease subunit